MVAVGCVAKQTTVAPIQPRTEPQVALPVISSLKADHQVALLGKTQVACTATEEGVDNLTYNWAATGGNISGTGSTVTWTAPDKSGDYMITVVVNDSKGGAAKDNVIVNVPEKPHNPPIISSIEFARSGHLPVTIKTNMTALQKSLLPEPIIRKYETAYLSCQASDPDGYSIDYNWQATGGKLIGTGPNVQWIAAGDPGIYTINVEVTDSRGANATFQIIVEVRCCGI